MNEDNGNNKTTGSETQNQGNVVEIPDTIVTEFKDLQTVLAFLKSQGYRISRSTIYRHHEDGRIREVKEGGYPLKAVLRYAKSLKKGPGDSIPSPRIDILQERRLEAEARKLEAQAHHWQLKTETAKGTLVPRSELELALAIRASIFKSDLYNFAHGRAPAIVQLVNGHPDRISDLVQFLQDAFEEILDRYVSDASITVLAPTVSGPKTIGDEEGDDDEGLDSVY